MIFKLRKRKQAVIDFFKYVESNILSKNEDSDISIQLREQLSDGRKLIEYNEWGLAFENLSEKLIEHFIILDREGIEISNKVLKLCKLDSRWKYDLRRIESLGYKKGSWNLANAEELAQEFRYTFYKPSREITKHLKVGNLVKLMFDFDSSNEEHPTAERMWVQITKVDKKEFKGALDNHPLYLHELYAGGMK